MSQSYRKTSTGTIICPNRGIIEVLSLDSGDQNAEAIIYEGSAAGRRLWDIKALAKNSNTTPSLNLLYKGGIYVVLSATGSGLSLTIR